MSDFLHTITDGFLAILTLLVIFGGPVGIYYFVCERSKKRWIRTSGLILTTLYYIVLLSWIMGKSVLANGG